MERTSCNSFRLWLYTSFYASHRERFARPGCGAPRQPAGGGGLVRSGRTGPLGPCARAGGRGPPAAGQRVRAHHRDRAALGAGPAGALRCRLGRRRGQRAGGGTGPPVRRRPAFSAGPRGRRLRADADRVRARGPVRRDHRGGARPDHRRPAGGTARLGAPARGVHRAFRRGRDTRRGRAAGRGPGRAAGDPGRPRPPGARLRARQRRSRPAAGRLRPAQPDGQRRGPGPNRGPEPSQNSPAGRGGPPTTRRRAGCSRPSARAARTGDA